MPSYDRALDALRTWLDSWSGIGHVVVGMVRQGFDLQLTRYDEKLASHILCDRDGAPAYERDGHGLGAGAVAGGAEGGVGGVREQRPMTGRRKARLRGDALDPPTARHIV